MKAHISAPKDKSVSANCAPAAGSATAIQAMIKRMIGAEDPARPLSDSTLAELLLKEGIQVARRTVAKYREALHIPPSHERKAVA